MNSSDDRLDAWYDGAICVIAVSAHGDPLDLAEHEVEAFIEKLQRLLAEARGEHPAVDSAQSRADG